MPQKKIFYLDNDKEKPVSAGGVLLYYKKHNEVYYLMIDSRGNYEDFGGRADPCDKSIIDTVSREAYEESNGLLEEESIKERLIDAKYIYSFKSKYVTFLLNANDKEAKLTSEQFGYKEINDDVPRKVKWVPSSTLLNPDIIRYKLNMRLKNKSLFTIIREIDRKLAITLDIFLTK